jgi:hypothetical protein
LPGIVCIPVALRGEIAIEENGFDSFIWQNNDANILWEGDVDGFED